MEYRIRSRTVSGFFNGSGWLQVDGLRASRRAFFGGGGQNSAAEKGTEPAGG